MLFDDFDFDPDVIPGMTDVELEEASDRAFGFLASNLCGDFGSAAWERFNQWYDALQTEQERRASRSGT